MWSGPSRWLAFQGFERRSAHHLSEGEKKRVALATVLAMDSEILALDEPTDNLDPAGSQALIERIRQISQTKIIITHHLALAMDLCDRAIFLQAGRKIEDLPMERLLRTGTYWSGLVLTQILHSGSTSGKRRSRKPICKMKREKCKIQSVKYW